MLLIIREEKQIQKYLIASSESAKFECHLKWRMWRNISNWPVPEYWFLFISGNNCSLHRTILIPIRESYPLLYLVDFECRITGVFGVSGSCLSWHPQVFYLSNREVMYFFAWESYACVGAFVLLKDLFWVLSLMAESQAGQSFV